MDDYTNTIPEEIEENNKHLLRDLRYVYTKNEDVTRSLDHARQQLFQNTNDRLTSQEDILYRPITQEKRIHVVLEKRAKKMRYPHLNIVASILVTALLVGTFVLVLGHRSESSTNTGASGGKQGLVQSTSTPDRPAATPSSEPPTSVMLRVNVAGISPTTHGKVIIPSGRTVTLTIIPNHSLLPFQTFTMGIYATDPYGFSELQYCTYPHTATCSYVVAYSSSEQTDYTKGTHTFRAFLGNIGGSIVENSSEVTITWS